MEPTMTLSNEAKTYKFSRTCSDCGLVFETNVRAAKVCSTACRKAFNNRRALRGAEMYDLMMKCRFDRKSAKDDATWSQLCALASAYRAADKEQRDGRVSWDQNAQADLPMGYSNAGDGR
jgi:hypothetical protein